MAVATLEDGKYGQALPFVGGISIASGYVRTELTEPLQNNPERAKYILGPIHSSRCGEPEDTSGSVLFLASSDSDFINSAILTVDGGSMAW
jgi:2-deoxy-D-gluconate 3-dehydrogenase